MSEPNTSYDEIPYESRSFPLSHPDHLATLGKLLGLSPEPVAEARVLELGCAAGNNIISIAEELPSSSFLGIDNSARQINDGNELVAKIGLSNIKLERADLMEFEKERGEFHYIICHGIFSWVPLEAQKKILSICQENLAANGLAYISYNTLPGWHLRKLIREMLLYHTEQFEDPTKKIAEAKAISLVAKKALSCTGGSEGDFVGSALAAVSELPDWYLYHDLIENENHPIYFSKFVELLEQNELRYLCEAELHTMYPQEFSDDVAAALRKLGSSQLKFEQYLDFFRLRMFRSSIVCHKEALNEPSLDDQSLHQFYFSSDLQPEKGENEEVEAFRGGAGGVLRLSSAIYREALLELTEQFPGYLSFEKLVERTKARVSKSDQSEDLPAEVRELLIRCVLAGAVDCRTTPPPVATTLTEHPKTRAHIREIAKLQNVLPNLRHESIQLPERDCQILQLLDGKHSLESLVGVLNVSEEEATESLERLLRHGYVMT